MAIVREKELNSLYVGIANALGAPAEEAEVFANCMVRADLRGQPAVYCISFYDPPYAARRQTPSPNIDKKRSLP